MRIEHFPSSLTGRDRNLAQSIYCAGLVCLLILSEVFSSNLQESLPGFSHFCRLLFTGLALVFLLAKCLLLTSYPTQRQKIILVAALAIAVCFALSGRDIWFLLGLLVGIGAKDIDLRTAVRLYFIVALSGLVLVQVLHFAGWIPFRFYCRNWDYGYGHYNGYGARLVGLFTAWAWLRWHRMRWYDWAGLAGLAAYTWIFPHSRGAAGFMGILLMLFLLQRLFPRIFQPEFWCFLAPALIPLFTVSSIAAGRFFDPKQPELTPLLRRIDRLLSGRLEIWHNVFWTTPISLFGGTPTDGDEHHAIDNLFLALWMNKGVIGAVLVLGGLCLLLWRLWKNGAVCEGMCLTALLCYWLMENKAFLLSANPLLLLLPCLLFTSHKVSLPVMAPQKWYSRWPWSHC